MKFLIIAGDVGNTAPGIVFDTLIKELSEKHDITLISPFVRSEFNFNISNVETIPLGYENGRVYRFSMSILGFNIYDYLWLKKQKKC